MAFPTTELLGGRVSCTDVVRCAFDLGEQDVRAYESLNDLGPSRVEDLARAVRRDPSVVYRSLQRLAACGVVEKRKRTLEDGGYFFEYAALSKAQVKRRLSSCVDDWHEQMKRAIARL